MKNNEITRRAVLAALGTVPLAGVLRPRWAWAVDVPAGPPVARIDPVSETLWGDTIVDPYRWMESPKDAEWEPFMRGQGTYARNVLDSIPGREALAGRIAALSGDMPITVEVQTGGGRVFYRKRPARADSYKLYVRDGLGGEERLLVDPTTIKMDGKHVSIDWWSASPDGRHVAYGQSPAGSEMATTHVIEVNSGKLLPERIERTPFFGASWLPDGSGFFYTRLAESAKLGTADLFRDMVACLHRLGTDPKSDRPILTRGLHDAVPLEPFEIPILVAEPSSAYVVAIGLGGVRRENPLFTARLDDVAAGKPVWRRVCEVADEVVGFATRGDDLYLLSTRDAMNARVLRTPVAKPGFAEATVVVPEGKAVIENIVAARDGLYVVEMDGGYNSLRRLDKDGKLTTAALPFDGAIVGTYANGLDDGAWVVATSWLEPYTVLRYDPATGRAADTGLSPRPPVDTARYEAIRTFATARDGTKVPLSIVARRGLKRDGSNPALVDAYGSYQISNSPAFNVRGIAFLEQGGVLATAHVRGGGEYGRRWWKAGQKLTKPNTWRDLIDCCEALVKDGWTSPRHLAIQGGSAGGITVGRAMTERPDLFAAVISNVGVSNTLRTEFAQNGPTNIDEFGTVTERDGFLGLKAMDAFHAVKDGTPFPAVLLTTGMTDPRVEPWQVAKMTARLQKATSSGNPVLLRVTFDAGHGVGSTRSQVDDERADEYAFVLWRTGAAGFQPKD
jgi:prolyl oligopeptidase